jgi:hypothetical protein
MNDGYKKGIKEIEDNYEELIKDIDGMLHHVIDNASSMTKETHTYNIDTISGTNIGRLEINTENDSYFTGYMDSPLLWYCIYSAINMFQKEPYQCSLYLATLEVAENKRYSIAQMLVIIIDRLYEVVINS